ncbi:S-layer homology domain-containing protein [Peptoanaerobacter stomatis]|uniref:S-layer homology domain-containing protein n=1 Tax=Peptoanaerobacter stomatis TaxID=796937 RepID=UPI003F9FCC08
MSKKINKRKAIVESKKGIYCTLLATGLLLQTCSYPVFADTGSSISNLGSIYALNTSQSDLQILNDRIGKLEAPTQAEDENIVINEHSLNLDVGDEFQLKLLDSDGTDVNNVEWFVRVRVPQDILYTAESFSRLNGVSISINDGLVKAKVQGNVEIWAKKGDALYKCVVNVEKEKDSLVEKKVEEIADKFRHLSSDVDKLMAVHDYLIDNIEYSNEHIVSYAYGALIEGKAVCQGYSQSFQKIIDNLNIEGRTLKGYSVFSGEYHQWNRVKLDDGWYFIDLTWDDLLEDQYRSYKYFLINSDNLGVSHRNWHSYDDEVDGTKYLYYAYKKQGVLANNEEELEQVLKAQINSSNSSNITVSAAIPKSIHSSTIISTIKRITGGNPGFREVNSVRDTFGTYQFYSYEVSRIPYKPQKNVNLIEIKPTNNVNETTTSVMLTFDEDIDDLTVNDIRIDDVHKTAVNKIDNKTYELAFKDMMFQSSKTVPVEVSKRGFNIANSRQNVYINIAKEEKPNVIFKATGTKEGVLENVESGMRYDLGDGVWHDINSSDPVNITTKFHEPIMIIKQSTTDSILHSDVQKILPIETVSPLGIKAVDSVGNKNNGKILYVNRKMEYKKKDAQNWISCIGKEVTGLSEGEYLVRYKPDGLKLASQAEEVKINVTPENNNSNESNNGNGSSSSPNAPEQSSEEQNKPNPKPDSQKPSQPSEEQNKPSQKPQDSKLDSQKTPEEQKESQKPKQKEEKLSSGASGGGGGGSSSPSKPVQKTAQTPTKTVTQEKVQEKSQISQSYQETSTKEIEVSDIMTVKEAEMTLNNLKDTKQITWSKQAVIKVIQKGIMSGDTNGNFMPKKSVTRAEVAQVIANIIGKKAQTKIEVSDVDNNKWYAKAVQTVLENKIFTQDEKGNFRPESKITRAELFVVIAKLKDIKPLDNTRAKEVLSKYTDLGSIPSWAIGYASALVEKGIVSGEDNKINANDMLTREQLATIFDNAIE